MDERMKWFDELIGIDGDDLDKICRGILITLVGLMEEAITSDNDKCIEKLFRDYLTEGEKFKELVEMDLPEKLRNNRMCTIYLVEVLKAISKIVFTNPLRKCLPNLLLIASQLILIAAYSLQRFKRW